MQDLFTEKIEYSQVRIDLAKSLKKDPLALIRAPECPKMCGNNRWKQTQGRVSVELLDRLAKDHFPKWRKVLVDDQKSVIIAGPGSKYRLVERFVRNEILKGPVHAKVFTTWGFDRESDPRKVAKEFFKGLGYVGKGLPKGLVNAATELIRQKKEPIYVVIHSMDKLRIDGFIRDLLLPAVLELDGELRFIGTCDNVRFLAQLQFWRIDARPDKVVLFDDVSTYIPFSREGASNCNDRFAHAFEVDFSSHSESSDDQSYAFTCRTPIKRSNIDETDSSSDSSIISSLISQDSDGSESDTYSDDCQDPKTRLLLSPLPPGLREAIRTMLAERSNSLRDDIRLLQNLFKDPDSNTATRENIPKLKALLDLKVLSRGRSCAGLFVYSFGEGANAQETLSVLKSILDHRSRLTK